MHWLRRLARGIGAATLAALLLAACSSGSSQATRNASKTSSPTASSGQAPSTFTLVIQNFAFHPADFTVAPGTTITVINRDGVDHTFTARNHAFDTGDIPPGGTARVRAPFAPGTYPYLCLIHPFMTGVMTVR
jgi:plastocyanin